MTSINAQNAQNNLYQLIADVNISRTPVTIVDHRGQNAVLLSERDWNALQETVFLCSAPGMAESILASREEPLEECSVYDEDEEW